MNKQKHLNLESRIIIETKLNEGESFKAIGRLLNKDCTTISKEVKNHISFEKAEPMAKPSMTASWLFNMNAPLKGYVTNVPPAKIAFAGPVANAPLPVFSTKSMFALNFPNLLMSVMAALNAINVP